MAIRARICREGMHQMVALLALLNRRHTHHHGMSEPGSIDQLMLMILQIMNRRQHGPKAANGTVLFDRCNALGVE
jgi:hypothetical protein